MTYKKLPLVFLFLITSFFGFGQVTELIISEYGEGSNNNKYIEIYNGTGNPVDLVDYSVELYSNGSVTVSNQHVFLNGTILLDDEVYILYNSSANAVIVAEGDIATSPPNFNGDDAVTLSKLGTIIDVIGEIGNDPGSGWDVAGTANGTLNHTLVRKSTVCSPNVNWISSAGTNLTDSEWIVYNENDWSFLGSHISSCNTTIEFDWCNLDRPASDNINQCEESTVYAQVYEDGITNTAGANPNIEAWIGYNTSNINPSDSSWTWFPASYNVQIGNNDEYMFDIGGELAATGTYYYASRFSYNSGPYSYGGYNAGGGGFWDGTNNVNGVVTVINEQANFCNVDFPKTGSINEGDPFNVYAQVHEPGITDAAGQGANIQAWIGYTTLGIDYNPWNSSGWTWVAATYDSDWLNNDQYTAEIGSGLSAGTYYFASRFQLNCNEYSYGGIQFDNIGNFWDYTNNNGVLTIVAPPTSTCVDEGFETGEPIDWSNSGSYYNTGTANTGTGKAGMNSTNDWIQTGLISNPSELRFYGRTSSTTADYTLTLETSQDGSNWASVTDLIADGTNSGDIIDSYQLYSINLNLIGDYYIRWRISARSGGSFYLDDVEVTCSACTPTHTVSSFSPQSGPVNTEVTITGTGFTGSSTVQFNGAAATIISQTSTELIVEVPSGASSGVITVYDNQPCEVKSPTTFTVISSEDSSCEGGVSASELFISEVTDATSGSLTYIEIYNGTGSPVTLSDYSIEIRFNAGGTTQSRTLSDDLGALTLASGDVHVISTTLNTTCSVTGGDGSYANQVTTLNGIDSGKNDSDCITLYNGTTAIDVWGDCSDKNWRENLGVAIGNEGFDFRRLTTASPLPNTTFALADWNIIDWQDNACLDDYINVGIYASGFPPIITTQATDVNAGCNSTNATLSIIASEGSSGGLGLEYQWYYSAPGNSGWTAVTDTGVYSGATTSTLSISNVSGLDNYQFYCEVKEDTSTCSTASDAVQMHPTSTTTWDGSTWDNGTPDINTTAIINGNYSTLTNNSFSSCQLTINSPFTLTISDNTYVEVENNLVVNGFIIVNPNGSFVQNNDLATVTVANYNSITVEKLTAIANQWYEYTYWSSPVNGESVANGLAESATNRRFVFNGANFKDSLDEIGNSNTFNTGQDDIDDDGNDWEWVSGASEMQSGIGYASTLNSTVFNSTPACPGCKIKYTFNGPFNNGSFSIPVYRNDSELNDNNWNFLGNPYPSAIDADLFLAMNSVIDTVDQGTIDGVIYFWSQHTPPSNGNSGNENINFPQSDYAIINASGQTAGGDGIMPERYIPSGQGFFISYSDSAVPDSVSGDIATGHVVFNNSMRVNDNNDIFFRTSYAEDNKLWLNLTSDNGVFNQILIAYVEAATQQYDGASYDTERNLSVQRFATIYSRINGQKGKEYAIQSKAPKDLSINEVIPIGLNTAISVPTLYKISIPRYEGEFFNSNPIYIKDKILNTIHNLKESDYVFTSEAGEFKNRFEIIFRKKGKPNKKVNDVENALSILKIREHQNGNLEFTLNSSNEFRNITILDMQGAVIYNLNATGNSKVFDLSNLKQTIYIAKVELTDGSIITEKVIKRK